VVNRYDTTLCAHSKRLISQASKQRTSCVHLLYQSVLYASFTDKKKRGSSMLSLQRTFLFLDWGS